MEDTALKWAESGPNAILNDLALATLISRIEMASNALNAQMNATRGKKGQRAAVKMRDSVCALTRSGEASCLEVLEAAKQARVPLGPGGRQAICSRLRQERRRRILQLRPRAKAARARSVPRRGVRQPIRAGLRIVVAEARIYDGIDREHTGRLGARETYVVHGPDEFEEIFELAEAGSPFELYSRARLKRVR